MSRAASPRFAKPGTPRLSQQERLGDYVPSSQGSRPSSEASSRRRPLRPSKDFQKVQLPQESPRLLQPRTQNFPGRSSRWQSRHEEALALFSDAKIEAMQKSFSNREDPVSLGFREERRFEKSSEATPRSTRLSTPRSVDSAYCLSSVPSQFLGRRDTDFAEVMDDNNFKAADTGISFTSEQKARPSSWQAASGGHRPKGVRPNRSILVHEVPNPFVHEKMDDGDFTKVTDTDFNPARARKELSLSSRLYRFLRSNNAEGNGTGLYASIISRNEPDPEFS